jgi:hypothetical protein
VNIYILTPTGCRPEGLALLAEYIEAQTWPSPLVWVVVDDGDRASYLPPMREGVSVVPVRPPWRWEPGMNTQADSMRVGLEYVPEDAVLFVLEDDDVYLPPYIETMVRVMGRVELAGERLSRYYNVASNRWREIPGKVHASMASTVCRGSALQNMREVCSHGRRTMLDVTLWKEFGGAKQLLGDGYHNVIGIKGLPGRPGIGVGHRKRFGTPDDGSVLRRWIGDYADNYGIFREAA